jgi:hypothetical protein
MNEFWEGFLWGVLLCLTVSFVTTIGFCLFFYRIEPKDKEKHHSI